VELFGQGPCLPLTVLGQREMSVRPVMPRRAAPLGLAVANQDEPADAARTSVVSNLRHVVLTCALGADASGLRL